MEKIHILGIMCACVSIFITASTNAGILTFTDRNTWRAAAGGGLGDLTEDLNEFSGTTAYGNPTGITAGSFTFATVSRDSIDPSWSIRDSAVLAGSKTVNGSPYVSLVAFSHGGDTLITHSNIGAIGFDYSGPSNTPFNDANPLGLTTSLGDTITGPTITGSDSGFFGFIYTEGEVFNSIQIRDLYDGRTFFGADNFEAFSAVTYGADADVVTDGQLNAGDLVVATRIVLELKTATTEELIHGDMNGDGQFTLSDLILIMQATLTAQ